MANHNPPVLSTDAELELSQLMKRSTELEAEAMAVNVRIRELNEQVAQTRRNAETGEAGPPRALAGALP